MLKLKVLGKVIESGLVAIVRTNSSDQAARIADPRSPAHQLGRQLNLPPAYLLIHRVTLSTIGVLCQLGATVRLRDELEAAYRLLDTNPDLWQHCRPELVHAIRSRFR